MSRGTQARPKTKWSQHVTETSDAMDLTSGVFQRGSALAIARSLKTSAEHSHRRKSSPFRSAMSMLNFYINRAGKTLPAARKRRLENAKGALRRLFGKAGSSATAHTNRRRARPRSAHG
ncbi:hypothetical protein BH10PSE18_BH10PSE18_33270 [soil metagenome]